VKDLLELPVETLAVLRKAGWLHIAGWVASAAIVAVTTTVPVGPILDLARGDDVERAIFFVVVVLVGTAAVAVAGAGPLLTRAPQTRALRATARAGVLLLPDVVATIVLLDVAFGPFLLRGSVTASCVPACLWLFVSAGRSPLAVVLVFLEERRDLLAIVERGNELASGHRLVVAATRLVPGVMVLGAVFQLSAGVRLYDAAEARIASEVAAITLLVVTPVTSSVLGLAAHAIATRRAAESD
jgi:hypothetical protein